MIINSINCNQESDIEDGIISYREWSPELTGYTIPYPYICTMGNTNSTGSTDGYGAGWQLFDGNSETYWYNRASDPWIEIDLHSPIKAKGIVLQGKEGYLGFIPDSMDILGSNDDKTFEKILTVSMSSVSEKQYFEFDKIKKYRYWRLDNIIPLYNASSETVIIISEMKFLLPQTDTSSIPSGSVIMWTGDKIPDGWALCDGQNGTYDLRGRFILGANDRYPIGSYGGEEEHTLTINEMPSHSHDLAMLSGTSSKYGYKLLSDWNESGERGNYSNFIYEKGNNQPHNNMPPYFALVYIMKL